MCFCDIRNRLVKLRRLTERVLNVVLRVDERVILMSVELDNLKADVTSMRGVVDSAVTLITGLAQQIADLKDDPAALQALSDDLKRQSGDLAAAVAANTPNPPNP